MKCLKKFSFPKLTSVVLLGLSISACGSKVEPAYNVKSKAFPEEVKKLSNEELGRKISRIALKRDWSCSSRGEGKLLCTLDLKGKHSATALITYDKYDFSINYVKSFNLRADKKGNVHKTYNSYVKKLENDIAKGHYYDEITNVNVVAADNKERTENAAQSNG